MATRKTKSSPGAKGAAATNDGGGAHAETPAEQVDAQLARYRSMRNFSTTAEPAGGNSPAELAATAGQLPFVIQKHAATRLHYDFRLGWRGTLKSWAVAKGPSYVVKDRRLAVEVEDHPIEYGGFEGIIPKGQYGGGTVLIWDQGTWEPQPGHTDVDEGLRHGSLKFILHGTKMHGKWTLVRMHPRPGERADAKPNWLLIKEHDEFERAADAPAVTDAEPDSAVTGRSLAQIAAAEDHTWQSNRPEEAPANHAANRKAPGVRARLAKAKLHSTVPVPDAKPAAEPETKAAAVGPAVKKGKAKVVAGLSGEIQSILERAPQEQYPGFLSPQLASPAHQPPQGPNWLHELKLDGYRVQLHLRAGEAPVLYTRTGLDWTHRMKQIAAAADAFTVDAAILDGEVVVLDEGGTTSFARLQASFDEGANHPLTLFAFDLLHLAGRNTRVLPLTERKALLAGLLASVDHAKLKLSEHVSSAQQSPAEVFAQACQLGAEGIISKRGDSTYLGTRNSDWLKLKCVRRQEFVIGGWTMPGTHSRSAIGGPGIGSLLLGYYADGKLVHCGRTGTGFPQTTQRMLRAKLEPLRSAKQPFANKLDSKARKDAIWVLPELVCEVEFTSWTADGAVRHASFQGLREDKRAEDVTLEEAGAVMKSVRRHPEEAREGETAELVELAPTKVVSTPAPRAESEPVESKNKPAAAAQQATVTGTKANPVVEGVRFTHPDKVLDAESGVTKLQLALYYQAIAPVLLPHIEDRPTSLVRCPDGAAHPCFFQKHVNNTTPKTLVAVDVKDKKTGKSEPYITVPSVEALVSLAQMGVLEIHPWGSRASALETPDRLIFDLDPDEALPWVKLVESARSIRSFLNELSLPSFVKTTGGKGLHLVVPIAPTVAWPEIKLFTRNIAAAIESSDPKLYLIKMTKAARKNRIFLDYLRNERGSTAVAPFSPRARPGMRVALPLAWEELDSGPFSFSVANFETWRARLESDPWARLDEAAQPIRPEVLEAVLAMAPA